MPFRILFQDDRYVAIEKPARFQVHPPENSLRRVSPQFNCLKILRDQLGQYIYPVHRIDRATSGVVVFALDSEAASRLSEQFRSHEIVKTYYTVCRGWIAEPTTIDYPLLNELKSERQRAITHIRPLAKIELPFANKRHATSRYTLAEVKIETGKHHQIRRHFVHASHPLIGDRVYGEGSHNRFFKNELGIEGLLLKAAKIEFDDPFGESRLKIRSYWGSTWLKVFDIFGFCPL